jgi:hypothetical protein
MAPLKIAFIGYNAELTNTYFRQFAADNAAQVAKYSRVSGRATLNDGTEIFAIPVPNPVALHGRRFDQVIIADDRRLQIVWARYAELRALDWYCQGSIIPEELRYQIYDIDAEAPKDGV